MTRLFKSTLSRSDFIDWMGGSNSNQLSFLDIPQVRRPSRDDVTLLWENMEDGQQAPPVVAIPEDAMGDFFAFTGTYIATYRPYSAFYRVVPRELVDEIQDRKEPLPDIASRFAKLVAGGAMAEHYLRSRERSSSSLGSLLNAIRSTLSTSLGSALLTGYSPTVMAWVADRWNSVHRASSPSSGEQTLSDDVVAIWTLLFSVVRAEVEPINYRGHSSQDAIFGFILTALRSDGVTPELLRSLGSDFRIPVDPAKVLLSSREERIRSFNEFVSAMGPTPSDKPEKPFLAGLLLAIAGNGSFDMLRSARHLAESLPAAIIWFGICAALFNESNVLTTGNCVGRRFTRDIRMPRSLFGAPQGDMNLFEYRALTRDPAALDQVNSDSGDVFCLELLPDVVTYIPRRMKARDARSLDELLALQESLKEIQYAVDRAQRRIGAAIEPSQQELFRSDRRPRSKPR